MRLEHIPLIIGAIVALIGLGFIADASMAASAPVTPERRRRVRAEPNRAGEAVVGVGTLCMAAALFGRDTWRYGTVAVLVGSTLLFLGAILNRVFLKEALVFRGPARRAEGGSAPGTGNRARAVAGKQSAAKPSAPAAGKQSATKPSAPAAGKQSATKPSPPAPPPPPSASKERRKTPRGKK